VCAQTKELDKLSDAAAKAIKKGDFVLADSLYDAYMDRFSQSNLPKGYQYSEVLISMARRAAMKGQTDKAIEIQNEVVEVRGTAPDCTFLQWSSAMSDLASFYSQKGDYTKAIAIGDEALAMLEKKIGKKHQYYNITLANQAAFYAARGQKGDIQTAVALGKTAVDGLKKSTPEYVNALNALAIYYSQSGDRVNAAKVSEQVKAEARKTMRNDMTAYASMMNSWAVQRANTGNYEEAIAFANLAKEGFERSGYAHTLVYTKLLSNMATLYKHVQNYTEAAKLLETAMNIIEQIAGKTHPDYLRCTTDLATVYKASGDLSKADALANETDASVVVSNEKSARALSRQGAVFASNGNYTRAIEHEQKAYAFFAERGDKLGMAQSMGYLASYYDKDGDRATALEKAEASLNLFRETGSDTIFYAQALNNTAIICFNAAQFDKATDYGRQARRLYEEKGDTLTAIYARILSNDALFSFVNGNVEQAIDAAEQSLNLQKGILGEDHPDNVTPLYNLAVYYSMAGRPDDASLPFATAMKLQSRLIRSAFLHLTSQEREKFWERKKYVFKYAPMMAYLAPQSAEMATMAYNSMLFNKSILLNSETDFRSIIRQSGDKDLISKYDKLEELEMQLEGYYRQSSRLYSHEELENMKREFYNLERTLVNGCKEYGAFTENLNIDVSRVGQSLADDEAAIEFADIYVNGRGNTYLAFVLRKNETAPKMVRLFSDDELDALNFPVTSHSLSSGLASALRTREGIDTVYNDLRLGRMVWQPLIKEMGGVKRIFFSPNSLFYQLGVEYLPCDSTHRIGDLYELHRLSSTKLLAMRNASVPRATTATVYGGLNYDMNLAQLNEQHQLQQKATSTLLAMNDIDATRAIDSLALRGSVGFLPGTLKEAESVGEQLMQHDFATDMFLGNEGTEETFKAMSGQSRFIIHIATHGFFFSANDLQHRNQKLVFLNEEESGVANPLNYSGLLLSGANYVLRGGKMSGDVDDGVLTANEIAHTDLSKTDLVVLSACQTGAGDIREDGVFGIQRGFKKAGAHSLIMSLWSVSDEATNLMMTSFYENYMAGMSKQKAFLAAQETMRRGVYSEPFFWASFILLDGF
jgi:CHAT domain-containing protein